MRCATSPRYGPARCRAASSPGVREGLRFATVNGAAAMNRSSEFGSLGIGKQADIIALRQDGLHFMPPAPAVPAIVLQARASDVDFVMVGGALRKRNGRLIGHDMARLRTAMLATQAHLTASLAAPGRCCDGHQHRPRLRQCHRGHRGVLAPRHPARRNPTEDTQCVAATTGFSPPMSAACRAIPAH